MEKIRGKKQPLSSSSSSSLTNGVWDCGSTLYDSFELKSLERQLDSVISSRSLSMPHLSDHHRAAVQGFPATKKATAWRISRSFQRLIRAVFRPKNYTWNRGVNGGGFINGFYDRSGALSTIPEGSELEGLSPKMRSLVTRTSSERFTAATAVGIYCP